MNNKKVKISIIERVVIIGLDNTEIQSLILKSVTELNQIKGTKYGSIINTYSSIHTNEAIDKEFLAKLPYGIVDITTSPLKRRSFTSFSLQSKTSNKHCTCLSINIILHSNPSYVLSTNIGIVLVSSKDLYVSHREILEHLYDLILTSNQSQNQNPNQSSIMISPMISSGGRSNSLSAANSLLYCSQLSTSTNMNSNNSNNNAKIKDYSSIDFFLSFILNSIYASTSHYGKLSTSLSINLITNTNSKQANFSLFKVYLDDNGNESIISLKDYDMSILLEKFFAEDLLKLYLAMLMEYRIIIVYDNNTSLNELNIIVQSLISLIFPLSSKHYHLIPYLTQSNIKDNVLNILSGIIIGIEYSHYTPIEKDLMISKTIIFSLIKKKIIYSNQGFPTCMPKTQNEVTGNLYQALAEKLSINSELSFEDTELGQMFEEKTCVKMNTTLYFNMRIMCIFYQLFLKILSSFNAYIKYENSKLQSFSSSSSSSSSIKNTNNLFLKYNSNDLFNYSQYKEDNMTNQVPYQKFLNEFSQSTMFGLFLKKYIQNYKSKAKYRFINQMLDVMASKKNSNQTIKRTFSICIKKKMTEYYNFTYVNYSKAYDNCLLLKMRDNNNNYYYTNTSVNSSNNNNNSYYKSINCLFKINSSVIKKCNEDYLNYEIKNTELIKKYELYNIYKEMQSSSSLNANAYSNTNSIMNMNKSVTHTATTINNNLNSHSSYTKDTKTELTSSPLPVSSFDLNFKTKNSEYVIPTSQFFNKEEIMVINEEEFKSIDTNPNDKQILTESKLFQMPLASKQPIQIGSILQQAKNTMRTSTSSAMGAKFNENTSKKKPIGERDKDKYKNKNETIGQQIKAILHSDYLSKIVNSASNKNLSPLIKNLNLVSSKLTNHNRYDLSVPNEVYSTRNAHSAIKKDIISLNNNNNKINSKTNTNSSNNNNKKKGSGNNNLPKLEGDKDCDIFSEND